MKYRKGMVLIHRQNNVIILLIKFNKTASKWRVFYRWISDFDEPTGLHSFKEESLSVYYKPISQFKAIK